MADPDGAQGPAGSTLTKDTLGQSADQTADQTNSQTLGLLGAGAFGRFMMAHLAPHFSIQVHDPHTDLTDLKNRFGAEPASLEDCVQSDIVILAVPVQAIEETAAAIAPLLRLGTLVLDVASVKVKPTQALARILPDHVDCVGTHPLFGPQSAKAGIEGHKISLCPVRGNRLPGVAAFCRDTLGLTVIETTPERHDRELAYVQGLTHLIGKTILTMDLGHFDQTTISYDLLREAVGFIQHDSAALFRAIELENPFAADARQAFFDAVRAVEKDLAHSSAEPSPGAGNAKGAPGPH